MRVSRTADWLHLPDETHAVFAGTIMICMISYALCLRIPRLNAEPQVGVEGDGTLVDRRGNAACHATPILAHNCKEVLV